MKGKADDESKVVTLEVSGRKITASVYGTGACAIVLGPGAGGTRETPQLLRVAAVLDPLRYTTVLFNWAISSFALRTESRLATTTTRSRTESRRGPIFS